MAISLDINGKKQEVTSEPDTPLLWVLRDELHLTGTKYGCGIGQCGACTVLIDDEAVKSCIRPVTTVTGKKITTIEGISTEKPHPVQAAWVRENVPQCGYCQPGQVMAAVALLKKNPNPTDDDINKAMNGNLCRCGTYQRIKKAIHTAAGEKP
jgi:aerobic-type carbon monoxide dehydrogenase small subunit (CoxS/CutS family)